MESGIIPLYKQKGMTSHDCVVKIRKLFKTKKVGHTGTLDPDVEGVLPICIGRATKIAEYITDLPKQYEAEITLGYATTTEDASGDIIDKKQVMPCPDENNIKKTLQSFQGRQQQIPPLYSAVKVQGKKLYEYARAGLEVERPVKDIEIYELVFKGNTLVQHEDTVSFRFIVTCSKGTYVRTLCTDIGRSLGFPAHMSELTRTRSGPFTCEEAIKLEEIENRLQEGSGSSVIYPMAKGLAHLPRVEVDEQTKAKILNGRVLPADKQMKEKMFLFVSADELLAVYQQHPTKEGLIKPKTMLRTI
ncbi:tRNA pseudouridine(55) synthase TruB [Bacillus piscicola]|uniref:tRNA pseudouridine(55) synthase TruB n=1 Tax=Bacillus piscicola TaxID=1632684 RepID=UPI001F08B025|nr:tRNA pseudouridine(55) synthase TruB [Bacillus piscicola]